MKIRAFFIALTIILCLCPISFHAEENDVRIAIVDTGISARAVSSSNLSEGKNYILSELSTEDTEGHGTAVTSIIVGSEPAGVKGISESALAIPLVFYAKDDNGNDMRGDANLAGIIIRDAVDVWKCNIINISSGNAHDTDVLRSACEYAENNNVLIVSCTGNDGNETVYYPGAYASTLCVGSLNREGNGAASFSNYHTSVDIVAPGIDIEAADVDGTGITVSGTSFSAAYVSGVASQLMSEYPYLDGRTVRRILVASAKDILDEGYDTKSGWGALDVENARRYAADKRIFRDVKKTDWYFESVNEAVNKGIVNGTDTVCFSPEVPTTRAMLWAMMYRMDGNEAKADSQIWYEAARRWAIERGISDGTDPDSAITREQMATMLCRFAKHRGVDTGKNTDLSVFSDYGDISGYALEAISWANANGLINGIGEGILSPKSTATRAQTATIFVRLAGIGI